MSLFSLLLCCCDTCQISIDVSTLHDIIILVMNACFLVVYDIPCVLLHVSQIFCHFDPVHHYAGFTFAQMSLWSLLVVKLFTTHTSSLILLLPNIMKSGSSLLFYLDFSISILLHFDFEECIHYLYIVWFEHFVAYSL